MTSIRGLTLSLLVHGLLLGLLTFWADQAQKNGLVRDLHKLIQFDPIKTENEFISLETQPLDNSKKPPVRYSAQNTQRVREETQARFLGPTVNRRFPTYEPTKKENKKELQDSDQTGTLAVQNNEEVKRTKIPLGISTVQSQLDKEIKFGDFTSLNTDQNLFFSFYTRAEARIRFHWEGGVESVIESLSFRNLGIRDERTFVTEVEVQLDREGKYLQTLLYRTSGVEALDQAVIHSFERSAPFVNPPREMVRDDGLIHLNYAFRVYFSPQFYSRH